MYTTESENILNKKFDNTMCFTIFCLIVLILSVVCGFYSGKSAAEKEFQKVLIDRGYVIYNPTNGILQWKNELYEK